MPVNFLHHVENEPNVSFKITQTPAIGSLRAPYASDDPYDIRPCDSVSRAGVDSITSSPTAHGAVELWKANTEPRAAPRPNFNSLTKRLVQAPQAEKPTPKVRGTCNGLQQKLNEGWDSQANKNNRRYIKVVDQLDGSESNNRGCGLFSNQIQIEASPEGQATFPMDWHAQQAARESGQARTGRHNYINRGDDGDHLQFGTEEKDEQEHARAEAARERIMQFNPPQRTKASELERQSKYLASTGFRRQKQKFEFEKIGQTDKNKRPISRAEQYQRKELDTDTLIRARRDQMHLGNPKVWKDAAGKHTRGAIPDLPQGLKRHPELSPKRNETHVKSPLPGGNTLRRTRPESDCHKPKDRLYDGDQLMSATGIPNEHRRYFTHNLHAAKDTLNQNLVHDEPDRRDHAQRGHSKNDETKAEHIGHVVASLADGLSPSGKDRTHDLALEDPEQMQKFRSEMNKEIADDLLTETQKIEPGIVVPEMEIVAEKRMAGKPSDPTRKIGSQTELVKKPKAVVNPRKKGVSRETPAGIQHHNDFIPPHKTKHRVPPMVDHRFPGGRVTGKAMYGGSTTQSRFNGQRGVGFLSPPPIPNTQASMTDKDFEHLKPMEGTYRPAWLKPGQPVTMQRKKFGEHVVPQPDHFTPKYGKHNPSPYKARRKNEKRNADRRKHEIASKVQPEGTDGATVLTGAAGELEQGVAPHEAIQHKGKQHAFFAEQFERDILG